jgi:hypothetical protein
MINKEEYGLIGYVQFSSFYCPKCHNFKDIFNAREGKDIFVCNWCNAKFRKLEPDLSEFPRVRIPMKFLTYMCDNCWEHPVETSDTLCEECRRKEERKLIENIQLNTKERIIYLRHFGEEKFERYHYREMRMERGDLKIKLKKKEISKLKEKDKEKDLS